MRYQYLRRILTKGHILLCLLAVLLVSSVKSQAQNVTQFTADNWTGCGTAYVQFVNQSSPAGGTASWNFGDGGAVSTLWNPTRSFTKPGVYNVTLTVKFPNGQTGSVTHTVNVYKKPDVKFATTPLSGCTPLKVNFTDQSTPGDGTITSVNWDFGDGNGATGATTSYTYNTGGDFKATSIVANSFGCTNSAEQLISAKATPTPSFMSNSQGGCKSPATINFTNTTTLNSTSPTPVNYTWDFGDGSTSTDMNPTHDFTGPGKFTVKLTATADGCSQTLTQTDYIVIAAVQGDFAAVEKLCTNSVVHFKNNTIPAPATATWTMPDGSIQNTVDAYYTFTAPGDYKISMKAQTIDGCEASVEKTVHVTEPPTASFTILPNTACTVPVNASFSATTTGATSWQWNFDDGGTATTQNPTHNYTTEGTYDVQLIASTADGCTATVNHTFIAQRPTLSINASALSGCIPIDITFTPNVGSADPVVKWDWNFGDGGTSAIRVPTHTFTTQGNYTVTLTITTKGGCTQTANVPVRVGTPVTVDFSVDKTSGCQPDIFSFTNLSNPPGTEWIWNFEETDGTTGNSTLQNPTYVFQTAGKHDVTLIVNNNGCLQQLTKPDMIEIFPPVARFEIADVDCANVFERRFIDRSTFGASTIQKWLWNFGDGNTSTLQNPVHDYTTPGVYTVTLTVDNGSCTSVWTATVNVIYDKPVIYADPTTVCKNINVNYKMDPVNTANYSSFTWVWGDLSVTPAPGNIATWHAFEVPSTYKTTLVITDIYGCKQTSDPVTINVNGSTANFTINPRQCKDEQVSFTDNSTTKTGNTIVSWVWDFGDNSAPVTYTAKPTNVTHTYSVISDYPVKLTVTDNTGCTDTYTDVVHIANIVARFGANDTIACLNTPFQFNNFSTEDPLIYAWSFGDGGTSTDKTPLHTYTVPGVYDIKLNITGSTGCTSSSEVKAFLRVPNPVADFSVPTVASDVCPPVKIQLTNLSSDYVRTEWAFGDGSTSAEDNPLHNYIRPGTFPVTLTVYSNGGCKSNVAGPKNIVIAGPDGTFKVTPETGCYPLTTSMTAVSPNAKKYIWDFGDGYSVTTTTPASPSYTYPQEGVYFPVVLLEDDRGCKVAALGDAKVVADKIHAAFTADASLACDGGTVVFADKSTGVSIDMGQAPTYAWDFGSAGGTGTGANPSFNYTGPGTYTVKLVSTSVYGCVDDTTMDIVVEPKPAAQITPVDPICAGSSVQLQGQDTKNIPNTKWTWTIAGKTYTTTTPPSVKYDVPGSQPVQLVITTASGLCSSTDSKTVEVSGFPALKPTPASPAICLGDAIQIQTGADPSAQITWTDYKISDIHSPNPTISPEKDTIYHIIAENTTGCKTEADVKVKVSQPFTINVTNEEMCEGARVQLHVSGATRYNWSPSTGLSDATSADPIATPGSTTTYTVTGFGNDQCFTDVKEAIVTVHPKPVINAGDDLELPVGSTIQLQATAGSDVQKLQWFPPSGLSCIDCLNPIATPRQSTSYVLTATSNYGCISSDEINIKMVCEQGVVFLPNTFTPNGDGQNDLFYIRGKGIKTAKSFRIYNRWGQLVFERENFNIEDPAFAWDGKAKGVPVNPDVFIYVAELVCDTNEPFTLKGNVMLLR